MHDWQALRSGQLRCESLIEQSLASAPDRVESVAFPGCARPVMMVRANDVLHVPRMRLQVLEGGIVPAEAVFNKWNLDFARGQFAEWGDAFEGGLAAVRSSHQGDVCILANLWSDNFYHWTTEEMAKVIVLERAGFTGSYVVSGSRRLFPEFLGCLGVAADRILVLGDEPTIFPSAVFLTPLSQENMLAFSGVYLALRDKLIASAGPAPATAPRRVWIHRGARQNSVRNLVNSDEVFELIARYGFEVVDMAEHGIPEQIAIANGAEVIMGPHGAGFTHALFMKPRSTVIECFSPEFINSGYWEICTLLRHRYFMLVHPNAYGVYEDGWNLKVDCFQLELLLQSLDLQIGQSASDLGECAAG